MEDFTYSKKAMSEIDDVFLKTQLSDSCDVSKIKEVYSRNTNEENIYSTSQQHKEQCTGIPIWQSTDERNANTEEKIYERKLVHSEPKSIEGDAITKKTSDGTSVSTNEEFIDENTVSSKKICTMYEEKQKETDNESTIQQLPEETCVSKETITTEEIVAVSKVEPSAAVAVSSEITEIPTNTKETKTGTNLIEQTESSIASTEQTQSRTACTKQFQSNTVSTEQTESGTALTEQIESVTACTKQLESSSVPTEQTESSSVPTEQTESGTVSTEQTESITVSTEQTESSTASTEQTESSTVSTEQTESCTVSTEQTESGTISTEQTESGTVSTEQTESNTVPTEQIEPGTANTEQTEYGIVCTKQTEPVTACTKQTDLGTAPKEKIESYSACTKQTETGTACTKQTEFGTAPIGKYESCTVTTEQTESCTVTTEQTESCTIPKEQTESCTVTTEQTESCTVPKEQTESCTVPKEQTESCTVPKEQTESCTVPKEQTESCTVPKEQTEAGILSREQNDVGFVSTDFFEECTNSTENIKECTDSRENIEDSPNYTENDESTIYTQSIEKSTFTNNIEIKEDTLSTKQISLQNISYSNEGVLMDMSKIAKPEKEIGMFKELEPHKKAALTEEELIERSTVSEVNSSERAANSMEIKSSAEAAPSVEIQKPVTVSMAVELENTEKISAANKHSVEKESPVGSTVSVKTKSERADVSGKVEKSKDVSAKSTEAGVKTVEGELTAEGNCKIPEDFIIDNEESSALLNNEDISFIEQILLEENNSDTSALMKLAELACRDGLNDLGNRNGNFFNSSINNNGSCEDSSDNGGEKQDTEYIELNDSNVREDAKEIANQNTSDKLQSSIKEENQIIAQETDRKRNIISKSIVDSVYLPFMKIVCMKCKNRWDDSILKLLFEGTEPVIVHSGITYGAILCMTAYAKKNNFIVDDAVKRVLDSANFCNKLGTQTITMICLLIQKLIYEEMIKCCDRFHPICESNQPPSQNTFDEGNQINSTKDNNLKSTEMDESFADEQFLQYVPNNISCNESCSVIENSSSQKNELDSCTNLKIEKDSKISKVDNYIDTPHQFYKLIQFKSNGDFFNRGSLPIRTFLSREKKNLSKLLQYRYDHLYFNEKYFSEIDGILCRHMSCHELIICCVKCFDNLEFKYNTNILYRMVSTLLRFRGKILLIPEEEPLLTYIKKLAGDILSSGRLCDEIWDENEVYSVSIIHQELDTITIRDVLCTFCANRKDPTISGFKTNLCGRLKSLNVKDVVGFSLRLYAMYCEITVNKQDEERARFFLNLDANSNAGGYMVTEDLNILPPKCATNLGTFMKFYQDKISSKLNYALLSKDNQDILLEETSKSKYAIIQFAEDDIIKNGLISHVQDTFPKGVTKRKACDDREGGKSAKFAKIETTNKTLLKDVIDTILKEDIKLDAVVRIVGIIYKEIYEIDVPSLSEIREVLNNR